MWNTRNPLFKSIYRFFKKHEYECLEKADYVTCLTHAAKKEMHGWQNISRQPLPMEVIPCSVDLDLFDPQNIDPALKQHYRERLNIQPGDIVFSYLGSIGGWYLADEMMQFCRKVSDKLPTARFLFISPHRHEQVIAAAGRAGLESRKIITTHAMRHEVPVLLSFSNYSLFFIKPCYSKLSSSPTKHGEIMAMGIPVITNAGVGDVKEIVLKYEAGVVMEDFSGDSMELAIDKIISTGFDTIKIRKAAEAFYSLEKAVQSYKNVYDIILSK